MEMRGIDPRTSRMLSERSTIWATPPLKNAYLRYYKNDIFANFRKLGKNWSTYDKTSFWVEKTSKLTIFILKKITLKYQLPLFVPLSRRYASQTSCSLWSFISLGIKPKQKAPIQIPKHKKHDFWNINKITHPSLAFHFLSVVKIALLVILLH